MTNRAWNLAYWRLSTVVAVACLAFLINAGASMRVMDRGLLQESEESPDDLAAGPEEEIGPQVEEEEEFIEKLCSGQAVYFFDAEFNWTAKLHPVGYPEDAHWSPMFGVVHNDQYEMYSTSSVASAAVEQIAEEGKASLLKKEVEECIAEDDCRDFLKFECDEMVGDCKMEGNFTVNSTYTMATMMSRAIPSPDWFTGFSVDLCNDGAWVEEIYLGLNASDAGTDAGKAFTSRNRNIKTDKRGNVTIFNMLSEDNPFYNSNFTDENNEVIGNLGDVVLVHLKRAAGAGATEDEESTAGAIVAEEVDTSDLTKEELKEFKEKEANLRIIRPENGCALVIGFMHAILATLSLLILSVMI